MQPLLPRPASSFLDRVNRSSTLTGFVAARRLAVAATTQLLTPPLRSTPPTPYSGEWTKGRSEKFSIGKIRNIQSEPRAAWSPGCRHGEWSAPPVRSKDRCKNGEIPGAKAAQDRHHNSNTQISVHNCPMAFQPARILCKTRYFRIPILCRSSITIVVRFHLEFYQFHFLRLHKHATNKAPAAPRSQANCRTARRHKSAPVTASSIFAIRIGAAKSKEQQATPVLHRNRLLLVKFGTAQINGLRGLLTEYDEVMPRS